MSQEKRDWRELCRAIVNEQDSDKLADLARHLLDVLDEHVTGTCEGVAQRKAIRFSGHQFGSREEAN
jgi:hypothetical protein